jgi:glucose/arabinose dehydrogenase
MKINRLFIDTTVILTVIAVAMGVCVGLIWLIVIESDRHTQKQAQKRKATMAPAPKQAPAKTVKVKQTLDGTWALDEDPSGALIVARKGDVAQIAIVAKHGNRMVVSSFKEVRPGLLECVTIDDPRSAARPGITTKLSYEFEDDGKLAVWIQGDRYVYTRKRFGVRGNEP